MPSADDPVSLSEESHQFPLAKREAGSISPGRRGGRRALGRCDRQDCGLFRLTHDAMILRLCRSHFDFGACGKTTQVRPLSFADQLQSDLTEQWGSTQNWDKCVRQL